MNNTEKRRRKAAHIREMRAMFRVSPMTRTTTHLMNRIVKDAAAREHGNPPKETLGDYWPIKRVHDGGLFTFSSDDHGESWCRRLLLPGQWDDEEIMYCFNVYERHGGPGRAFERAPYVERSEHSTLVTQYGGLDI